MTRRPRTYALFVCHTCHHEQLIPIERAERQEQDDPMRCTHGGPWRDRPAATMVRAGTVTR